MPAAPRAEAIFSVAGKRALVTGASSGLGVRFAAVLASHGAEVVLAARRLDRLDAVARDIRAAGGRAHAVAMDVASADSVTAGMDAAIAAAGGIDILVNNAGVSEGALMLDTSDETWRRTMEINLDGAFRVAREAAARMRDGGGGSIVNIASVLSFEVQKAVGAYAAAKAAVWQMTRVMAIELARYSIRVNAIAPGYFLSEMTESYFASEAGQRMIHHLPPGRPGDPAELDGALMLLASDAGSYMTGATITVDGGHSLLMP